jgi:hypothetical protein
MAEIIGPLVFSINNISLHGVIPFLSFDFNFFEEASQIPVSPAHFSSLASRFIYPTGSLMLLS